MAKTDYWVKKAKCVGCHRGAASDEFFDARCNLITWSSVIADRKPWRAVSLAYLWPWDSLSRYDICTWDFCLRNSDVGGGGCCETRSLSWCLRCIAFVVWWDLVWKRATVVKNCLNISSLLHPVQIHLMSKGGDMVACYLPKLVDRKL